MYNSKKIVIPFVAVVLILIFATNIFAIEEIIKPDGTKITRKKTTTTTKYSNPHKGKYIIVGLATLAGLTVVWMGFRLISKRSRNIPETGNAELEFSFKDKSLKAKNLTQGLFLALLGVLIILAALFWVSRENNSITHKTETPQMHEIVEMINE